MARYEFKLPDVGEGVAEAEIVEWRVKPGDHVEEDQPFLDVMTDKATVEITSPASGRVVSLEGGPGMLTAVGAVVAVLETGEVSTPLETPPPALRATSPADAGEESAPAPPPAGELSAKPTEGALAGPPPVPTPPQPAPKGPVLAAPAVRRRASDLGLDLAAITGTGEGGRVTHQDLDRLLSRPRAAAARPAPSSAPNPGFARAEGAEVVKLIGLRRRIAEKMAKAKSRIPHFSYIEEIDVTDLEDLRARLNARPGRKEGGDRPKLTVLPFLARAMVKAIEDFPQMNALFDDEAGEVHRHKAVDIGVAVQTPAGLMVPVVRHVEALDLWGFAAELARLSERARAGKAASEELSGSTITITSLGALGGIATTPVINHPEVAIIGPNRIVERPAVVGGAVVVRKLMNLSSSFDHRVVDGADAAAFIQRIKALLEAPALLLVD